jgi:hypothetical protein
VKIGKRATKTLGLLTLAYGEYAVKKPSVFNGVGGSRKIKKIYSQFMTILVCFFDHKGTVHYEFLAQGQAVNPLRYLEVLTGYGNLFGGKDPNSGLTNG